MATKLSSRVKGCNKLQTRHTIKAKRKHCAAYSEYPFIKTVTHVKYYKPTTSVHVESGFWLKGGVVVSALLHNFLDFSPLHLISSFLNTIQLHVTSAQFLSVGDSDPYNVDGTAVGGTALLLITSFVLNSRARCTILAPVLIHSPKCANLIYTLFVAFLFLSLLEF